MSLTVKKVLKNLPIDEKVAVSGFPSSAYLHIPFCRRRCFYCDFPVSVVGDRQNGDNSGTIAQYVEVLCEEINVTATLGKSLKTVFFGGGTPSLLSVSQVERLLNTLDKRFGIDSNAEISMEMDPGTFDKQQIQGYRNAGVNRISLGVQAFQNSLLKICGRSHTVSDIFAAIDLIQQVGFPDFSLDLISGLPHQTIEQWQESLQAVVAIAPTHISTYDLTIEPVTAFGRYYQAGATPLPADETTAQMYRLAQKVLTDAGYEHYEISNYAQPGHQCRHNRVYWENRPYYAFGMGAASYVEGFRFTRPRKTREYYQWVQQLTENLTPQPPSLQGKGELDSFLHADGLNCPQTRDDILLETLMLGLRLADGLSLSTLVEQFGEKTLERIWRCLQPYQRQGWVEIIRENGTAVDILDPQIPAFGRLRLTDPEGFLFSNTVLATLFDKLG